MKTYRPGASVTEHNALPVRPVGTQAEALDATTPLGYVQISSSMLKSAQRLTPPDGAMRAVVQNNGGSTVRWRDDGIDPTTMHGMRIRVDDQQIFTGDLTLPAFIDEGDNSVLDVSFYG